MPLTGDGEHARIAKVDRMAVSPTGARIVVSADADGVDPLSPLLVARIVVDATRTTAGTA